jgi:hypothetical protein
MDTNITFKLEILSTIKFTATIERYFDTEDAARELADTLPKWMKAKVRSIGRIDPNTGYNVKYFVYCWAPLWSTTTNERNESGIKRLHKLIANYNIEYINTMTAGGHDTLEEALAAVAL